KTHLRFIARHAVAHRLRKQVHVTPPACRVDDADLEFALVESRAGRDCKITAVTRRLADRCERCVVLVVVNFKCERLRVPVCKMTEAGKPKGAFADTFLQPRLHALDHRSIQTNTRHQYKVTALIRRLINHETEIDLA